MTNEPCPYCQQTAADVAAIVIAILEDYRGQELRRAHGGKGGSVTTGSPVTATAPAPAIPGGGASGGTAATVSTPSTPSPPPGGFFAVQFICPACLQTKTWHMQRKRWTGATCVDCFKAGRKAQAGFQ